MACILGLHDSIVKGMGYVKLNQLLCLFQSKHRDYHKVMGNSKSHKKWFAKLKEPNKTESLNFVRNIYLYIMEKVYIALEYLLALLLISYPLKY